MADDLPDREGAAEQLRASIEYWERLNDDSAAINDQKRDLRKRLKSEGFDVATVAEMVKRRAKDPKAVLEADLLLETYEQALGCGAAAAGMLSAKMGADGVFQIAMVAGPQPDAGAKLTKATKARRDAVALAELARQAREQQ
jgi:uncharacterized protein (UPF0335 family)